jgi:predicted phage terminase large subunit-like protein
LSELAKQPTPDGIVAYGELAHGHRAAPHHRALIEFFWGCILERAHGVALLARGAAKTTWADTILIAWLLAQYDLRVGLVSNTDLQSLDFSRAIKWTFEQNAIHRDLFGDQVNPAKWTNKEWVKAGSRYAGTKDVSLFAVGVGGAIISKRFDVLLMDDILDEENTGTPEARAAVREWFLKTLKPCLAPDGVILTIGTRWAEDDLYEHLMTPRPKGGQGWRNLVVPALTEDEAGNLVSYWPEVWPVPRLLEEKDSMGSALFACAYQNDISGLLEGNVFKGPFDHFDALPEGHQYIGRMGIDLASSTRETADYTARVTTFEDVCPCDAKGTFYVLSAYRDRRESHHAEFVLDGYAAYPNIDAIIIETNQFQSTLVQELMTEHPRLPVIGKKTDTDKMTRARAVAARFEGHKVRLHRSLVGGPLESELLSFPRAHDDLVDALGQSMDLAGSNFFYGSLKR